MENKTIKKGFFATIGDKGFFLETDAERKTQKIVAKMFTEMLHARENGEVIDKYNDFRLFLRITKDGQMIYNSKYIANLMSPVTLEVVDGEEGKWYRITSKSFFGAYKPEKIIFIK